MKRLQIIVYIKPASVQCTATLNTFKNKGVKPTIISVHDTSPALAIVKELGYLQAPVVIVHNNGEIVDHWSGFRPDKIEELIKNS